MFVSGFQFLDFFSEKNLEEKAIEAQIIFWRIRSKNSSLYRIRESMPHLFALLIDAKNKNITNKTHFLL
jgi:hypothetical protein